jgi:hypothetical protein
MTAARLQPSPSHPAPQRRNISAWVLLFALLGAPLAWFALELGGWGLASLHCSLKSAQLQPELMRASAPLFLVLAAAAFAIALAGTAAAWQAWNRTRREKPDGAPDLAQSGEGRTRFVALTAFISSVTFMAGFLFHAIQLWFAPLCGG